MNVSGHHPESDRPTSGRIERRLAAIESHPRPWLAAVAFLLALQINPWWHATPDAAMYLSTARSIAAGGPVTSLGSFQIGLPPGYPLFVSPAFWIGERPFLALSIAHWFLALLFIAGVYHWARRQVPAAALLLTLGIAVNLNFWLAYRRTLSELLFMTLLIWTVNALNSVDGAATRRQLFRRAGLATLLALFLTLTREVGVVVAAGFAVHSLIAKGSRGRQRRVTLALLVAVPTALSVLAFVHYETVMRSLTAAPLGSHLDGWTAPEAPLAGQWLEIVRVRITETGRLLLPAMYSSYGRTWADWNMAAYVPLGLCVIVGWWRFIRRRREVLACTAPFYAAVYLTWPFEGGTRYILPLLPLLVTCLWMIIEPLERWRRTLCAVTVTAHLAVAVGYVVVVEIPQARECDALWPVVDHAVTTVASGATVALDPRAAACLSPMLAYSLDRQVRLHHGPSPDTDVQWILAPAIDEVPPGFAVHSTAGAYRLSQRRS